ncbi:MAG: heavy-metal-associated domain-containing protein [Candidatus Nitrosocosmicus sp.]
MDGRYCDRCKIELEEVLEKLDGIKKVEINYITNIVILQYDPRLISRINLANILDLQCKFIKVKSNNPILEL